MNAIHQKFTKANANENAPRLLKDCFLALRQHTSLNKQIKQFQYEFASRKAKEAMQFWLGISKQTKQREEIVAFF